MESCDQLPGPRGLPSIGIAFDVPFSSVSRCWTCRRHFLLQSPRSIARNPGRCGSRMDNKGISTRWSRKRRPASPLCATNIELITAVSQELPLITNEQHRTRGNYRFVRQMYSRRDKDAGNAKWTCYNEGLIGLPFLLEHLETSVEVIFCFTVYREQQRVTDITASSKAISLFRFTDIARLDATLQKFKLLLRIDLNCPPISKRLETLAEQAIFCPSL